MQGYEEIDLSLKAVRRGYWNVWTCFASVQLIKDSIDDNVRRDAKKFAKVWKSELKQGDSFYHVQWKELKLV